MIIILNFIPSLIILVNPELRLEITSSERLIGIFLKCAIIASIIIRIVKIGTAKNKDLTKKLILTNHMILLM